MLAIYLFFIIGCWFNFRLVSGVEDELDGVKVAYITAIFGAYEMRLKPIHKQTMASDAFCFTDNIQLQPSVGWTIITHPYHETHPSKLDNGQYYNSFAKNKHPFNIAKYYKENFQNIPILRKYDVIVWIDGSLEIEFDGTSAWLYNKIRNKGEKIILFHHEMRYGILAEEAQSCDELDKYNNDKWLGFPQPIQYGMKQYNEYLEQGYDVTYWSKIKSKIGNTDPFNLKYTTQDQVSFPFVAQKLNIIPYTLPDAEIWGAKPHQFTKFFWKWDHGKRRLSEQSKNATLEKAT